MRHHGARRGGVGLLGLLLVAASGCSSLEYMDSEELWREGDANFDSGDYDDALPYYDELLRRDEHDTLARTLRGVARERSGEPRGALQDYGQAGMQGDVRGYLYSANLHLRQGELTLAEEDLGRLRDMGLSGRDRVAHLTLLGTLRVDQGQYLMGAQSLERAVSEGQAYGDGAARACVRDAHYNAAKAYYRMGDFGRAYDHFIAYGDAGSMTADDHYQMGVLAYLAGDFDAAETHFAQADSDKAARAAEILDDPSLATGGKEVPK